MELYNEDCFNILPNLEDKSVNLFVLDLPFNQTNFHWDKDIIDLKEMWKHIKRIIKDGGIILFFCSAKFGFKIIESNKKWFKQELIWEKSTSLGWLDSKKRVKPKHELIYIFKGKQGTYNPQMTQGKPNHPQGKGNNANSLPQKAGLHKATKGQSKGESLTTEKYPTSILKFNNIKYTIHRTQKPVDLLEWLIKTYSNEGETVCDFTFGSGSSAIASLNTKRKFIGVEKDKEIFDLAKKRIEEFLNKKNNNE